MFERYYRWKYSAEEGSSKYTDELCPCLLELYHLRAAQQRKPIEAVSKGTVYLVPPLKLGVPEAYQVDYFREAGVHVGIGSMHSLGGSAPITLAGAMTLNLAVIDMRTTSYHSAPVERRLANLMTAQIAQFYRASFTAHGNLTDAKWPGREAGMQKVITALPVFTAGGDIWMSAGLLSVDQICSPLQLVLDNELMGALKRFVNEYDASPETIGLDTILEVGPGGNFFVREHSARHMRKEIWQNWSPEAN